MMVEIGNMKIEGLTKKQIAFWENDSIMIENFNKQNDRGVENYVKFLEWRITNMIHAIIDLQTKINKRKPK
jgi:hypothetical protein